MPQFNVTEFSPVEIQIMDEVHRLMYHIDHVVYGDNIEAVERVYEAFLDLKKIQSSAMISSIHSSLEVNAKKGLLIIARSETNGASMREGGCWRLCEELKGKSLNLSGETKLLDGACIQIYVERSQTIEQLRRVIAHEGTHDFGYRLTGSPDGNPCPQSKRDAYIRAFQQDTIWLLNNAANFTDAERAVLQKLIYYPFQEVRKVVSAYLDHHKISYDQSMLADIIELTAYTYCEGSSWEDTFRMLSSKGFFPKEVDGEGKRILEVALDHSKDTFCSEIFSKMTDTTLEFPGLLEKSCQNTCKAWRDLSIDYSEQGSPNKSRLGADVIKTLSEKSQVLLNATIPDFIQSFNVPKNEVHHEIKQKTTSLQIEAKPGQVVSTVFGHPKPKSMVPAVPNWTHLPQVVNPQQQYPINAFGGQQGMTSVPGHKRYRGLFSIECPFEINPTLKGTLKVTGDAEYIFVSGRPKVLKWHEVTSEFTRINSRRKMNLHKMTHPALLSVEVALMVCEIFLHKQEHPDTSTVDLTVQIVDAISESALHIAYLYKTLPPSFATAIFVRDAAVGSVVTFEKLIKHFNPDYVPLTEEYVKRKQIESYLMQSYFENINRNSESEVFDFLVEVNNLPDSDGKPNEMFDVIEWSARLFDSPTTSLEQQPVQGVDDQPEKESAEESEKSRSYEKKSNMNPREVAYLNTDEIDRRGRYFSARLSPEKRPTYEIGFSSGDVTQFAPMISIAFPNSGMTVNVGIDISGGIENFVNEYIGGENRGSGGVDTLGGRYTYQLTTVGGHPRRWRYVIHNPEGVEVGRDYIDFTWRPMFLGEKKTAETVKNTLEKAFKPWHEFENFKLQEKGNQNIQVFYEKINKPNVDQSALRNIIDETKALPGGVGLVAAKSMEESLAAYKTQMRMDDQISDFNKMIQDVELDVDQVSAVIAATMQLGEAGLEKAKEMRTILNVRQAHDKTQRFTAEWVKNSKSINLYVGKNVSQNLIKKIPSDYDVATQNTALPEKSAVHWAKQLCADPANTEQTHQILNAFHQAQLKLLEQGNMNAYLYHLQLMLELSPNNAIVTAYANSRMDELKQVQGDASNENVLIELSENLSTATESVRALKNSLALLKSQVRVGNAGAVSLQNTLFECAISQFKHQKSALKAIAGLMLEYGSTKMTDVGQANQHVLDAYIAIHENKLSEAVPRLFLLADGELLPSHIEGALSILLQKKDAQGFESLSSALSQEAKTRGQSDRQGARYEEILSSITEGSQLVVDYIKKDNVLSDFGALHKAYQGGNLTGLSHTYYIHTAIPEFVSSVSALQNAFISELVSLCQHSQNENLHRVGLLIKELQLFFPARSAVFIYENFYKVDLNKLVQQCELLDLYKNANGRFEAAIAQCGSEKSLKWLEAGLGLLNLTATFIKPEYKKFHQLTKVMNELKSNISLMDSILRRNPVEVLPLVVDPIVQGIEKAYREKNQNALPENALYHMATSPQMISFMNTLLLSGFSKQKFNKQTAKWMLIFSTISLAISCVSGNLFNKQFNAIMQNVEQLIQEGLFDAAYEKLDKPILGQCWSSASQTWSFFLRLYYKVSNDQLPQMQAANGLSEQQKQKVLFALTQCLLKNPKIDRDIKDGIVDLIMDRYKLVSVCMPSNANEAKMHVQSSRLMLQLRSILPDALPDELKRAITALLLSHIGFYSASVSKSDSESKSVKKSTGSSNWASWFETARSFLPTNLLIEAAYHGALSLYHSSDDKLGDDDERSEQCRRMMDTYFF